MKKLFFNTNLFYNIFCAAFLPPYFLMFSRKFVSRWLSAKFDEFVVNKAINKWEWTIHFLEMLRRQG